MDTTVETVERYSKTRQEEMPRFVSDPAMFIYNPVQIDT